MFSEFIGGCIIPENLWPTWSPDLSQVNLYLWGFLIFVYRNNLYTLEEFK
jgi:hypothetical protein